MTLPEIVGQDAVATSGFLSDMFDQMDGPADRLVAAMRYATMNGGKRMRAALVLGAGRLATQAAQQNGAPATASARPIVRQRRVPRPPARASSAPWRA